MRILLILLVLAVATLGVLYALGIFDASEPLPVGPDGDGARTPEAGTEDGGTGTLGARVPLEEPPVEAWPVTEPIDVLLLAGVPQRLNAFLAQQWSLHEGLRLRSWAPPLEGVDPERAIPPPEQLQGYEPRAPHPDDVAGLDVLAIHDMDPGVLEAAFWERVAEAVRAGELGLLVVPGLQHGPALHQHPVLGPLLPVEAAASAEGAAEGAQPEPAPFRLTRAGARHAATRLVRWPSWSERLWEATRTLEHPWGTKFVYPVTAVAEGASVLLDADPSRGEDLPALVAGPPADGRVLWLGAWELGPRQAYGRPETVRRWRVLVLDWAIWLAGQAPTLD